MDFKTIIIGDRANSLWKVHGSGTKLDVEPTITGRLVFGSVVLERRLLTATERRWMFGSRAGKGDGRSGEDKRLSQRLQQEDGWINGLRKKIDVRVNRREDRLRVNRSGKMGFGLTVPGRWAFNG